MFEDLHIAEYICESYELDGRLAVFSGIGPRIFGGIMDKCTGDVCMCL